MLKKLLSDDLLKHSAVVFAGMAVVHVCNLFFQMAVTRRLSGEEYTLLTAFLGVLVIISLPLSMLTQLKLNRFF